MQIWQAIILGAVQGITEFLPISSSGHLILLQRWFGITEGAIFYSIMLHLATLIPIIIVLFKQIIGLFKKPFGKMGCLILATIPAGIVGLIFSLKLDLDLLFAQNIWLLGITFILTAIELIFTERYSKKVALNNKVTAKTSFIMGLGQAVGVFPGISRSGSTITFGTLAKVDKEENAHFTFLMSIPIILAAVLLQVLDGIKNGFGQIAWLPLAFGMITAMLTGYIAIKFMLRVIKKANYKWFSLYLVLVSIATFVTAFV